MQGKKSIRCAALVLWNCVHIEQQLSLINSNILFQTVIVKIASVLSARFYLFILTHNPGRMMM